jgi:hypothetical protein
MTQRTVLWPYPVGPRVAAPHTRAAGITALKWAEKTSRAVERQICIPSRRHQASSSSTWSPQGEGAFAALDYAVSYPNALLTLVLACSTLNIQEKDIQAPVNGITAPRSASLPAYFYELGPTYRAADPQGTQRWRSLERTSQLAGNVVQGVINRIGWATLRAMQVRTLLLAGDADLIAPPPIMAMAARHILNSRLA